MHLCTSALLLVVCLSSVAHARNFCAECHTNQEVSSFENILVCERSIYQDKHTSCPPLKRIKEEVYFTESQIVKYSQLLEELEKNRMFTGMMEKNLAKQVAAYGEAITVNPASLEDFTINTMKIKNQLNKVYIQINQIRERLKMRKVFGTGVLATISILFFTLLGIKKTFKVPLISIALFILGLSWGETKEVHSNNRVEIERVVQTAEAMENLSIKAFVLSKIASELNHINQMEASQVIDRALEIAHQIYSAYYLNYVSDVRKVVASWPDEDNKRIFPIIERMENTCSRVWLLRVIATDMVAIDKERAGKIFEDAVKKAEKIQNRKYHDLDLRGIAGEMAKLNTEKAIQIARRIKDPKIKAWALRAIASEIAEYNKAKALMLWNMAIEEIEKINDITLSEMEVDRKIASMPKEVKEKIFLLEKTKITSKKAQFLSKIALEISRIDKEMALSVFKRAVQVADKIEKPYTKAYTLSDIAGDLAMVDIKEASRITEKIDMPYADACFSALMSIAGRTAVQEDLEKAAAVAERIEEPYDRAKALSRVASSMVRLNKDNALELAKKIEYPYIRSQALSVIAIKWSEDDEKKILELIKKIEDPFIRSKTLKEIAISMNGRDKKKAEKLLGEAAAIAEDIKSTYLLWNIAAEWIKMDKNKLLDMAGKIEGDNYNRSVALIKIALDWSKSDVSRAEMMLEMAVRSAERVEDPYTRAKLLKDMAVEWAKVDVMGAKAIFGKAVEAIEP